MCYNFKLQGKQLKYGTGQWLISVADKSVLKRTFYVTIKVICGIKKREGHLERYLILLHVELVI
jgi:hypothetical protein